MKEISFNGTFRDKCTYYLIGLGLVTFILTFALLNIPRDERLIAATLLIGLETHFVFYLNRFEPKLMRLHNENFEITYSNYKFFEKEAGNYMKENIKVIVENSVLILSNNDGIIGKVRKKAVSNEDWKTVTEYFIPVN